MPLAEQKAYALMQKRLADYECGKMGK